MGTFPNSYAHSYHATRRGVTEIFNKSINEFSPSFENIFSAGLWTEVRNALRSFRNQNSEELSHPRKW